MLGKLYLDRMIYSVQRLILFLKFCLQFGKYFLTNWRISAFSINTIIPPFSRNIFDMKTLPTDNNLPKDWEIPI